MAMSEAGLAVVKALVKALAQAVQVWASAPASGTRGASVSDAGHEEDVRASIVEALDALDSKPRREAAGSGE